MKNIYGLKGNFVYTQDFGKFKIEENKIIIIENGIIKGIYNGLPFHYKDIKVIDYKDKLIIPGFVDLHLHAPQFPNMGLGVDKELIPWLNCYTFPEESKYSDLKYAERVYRLLIKELWNVGTTRCCVFSTIHKDSTKLLFDLFNESGLGAYVGKVNMDRECPDVLIEDTIQSLKETELIAKEYINKYSLVKPIITPRFVPSCSFEMLKGLLIYNRPFLLRM